MPRRVSDGLALGEMFLGSRMRRDKLRLSSYCGVVLQINAESTPHTKAGLPQLAGQVVRHGYEALIFDDSARKKLYKYKIHLLNVRF